MSDETVDEEPPSLLEEKDDENEEEAGKKKKMLYGGGAVLALILVVFVSYFFLHKKPSKKVRFVRKEVHREKKIFQSEREKIVKMRNFAPLIAGSHLTRPDDKIKKHLIVLPGIETNLVEKNNLHLLFMLIGIFVADKVVEADVLKKQDIIIAQVLSIVGMRRMRDMLTTGGRIMLKEDLLIGMNRKFPEFKIQEVVILEILTK